MSVLIPTRDRPELLRRAVASVLAQDYPGPLECIVVVDGPDTDVSLPSAENRTVRVISNERTQGTSGARNTGILAATQDVIALSDDDDEWLPHKLRRQIPLLVGADRPSIVASALLLVRGGKPTRVRSAPEVVTFPMLIRDRIMELHPSSMTAMRQRILDEVGLFDEGVPGSYGEDYDWLLRAARVAPIRTLSEPLIKVYWHGSSYFFSRWKTIADALQYLLNKYPEFSTSPRGSARVEGQIAFAYSAMGQRAAARQWAKRALRHNPRELRAAFALLVSTRLVTAEAVQRLAHATNRGI